MKDFDVIVIGSGIGGLVSAGVLASKGLKVLVLEKHSSAGGYLSSFKRKGFTFDSAVDCIAGIGKGKLISHLLEKLGVERSVDFIRINPIRRSIFPDMRIEVDSDIDIYIESLERLFPAEKNAIKDLFQRINEIYSEMENRTEAFITGIPYQFTTNNILFKYATRPYAELIQEFTNNPRLAAVLSDRCPFLGLPPSKALSLPVIALIMSYFKMGAYRPVGGHQKLSDALVKGIKNKGGKVLFNKEAEKIILSGDTCSGVVTSDKEEYKGKFIISNADFIQTFRKLIGGRHSSLADEALKNIGISSSFFIVYAGIKDDLKNLGSSSIGHFPSYDMESFFDSKNAFKKYKSSLGLTIPSIEDNSLAPKGCHSLIFHEMIDFDFVKEWDKHKEEFTDKVLDKAEALIPDIRKNSFHIEAATPMTLKRYTSNYHGAAYGWKHPGWANPIRHNINHLFLAGHWGDMGGGVLAAAYSGIKAAVQICQREGISTKL